MSKKWFMSRVLMIVVTLVVILAVLIPVNNIAWKNIQATGGSPQYTYQWFADNNVCDGRPGQLGWSTTKLDGTVIWCTNDGAIFKNGQPGKFPWWEGNWKLYNQRKFLGWWPVHWFEMPWWWDTITGWIPCLLSGDPDKC